MAKKNSGLGGVAIFLGLAAAGALALPREFGMALWVIAVVVVAVYLYRKIPEATPPAANPPKNKIRRPAAPKQPQPRAAQFSPASQPRPAPRRVDAPASVPPPPKGFGQATWVPKGQPISVGGLIIPGGMLYFGRSLKTLSNQNDPSLIDPSKSLSGQGDFTAAQTDYWPNYSAISASARGAYLNWLADGKKHPEADIGYVFLYFYGLERRAIIDLSTETGAREDLPGILQELRRLVDIYGAKSSSFSRYASGLISWVELADPPENLYEQDIPDFARTREVPAYIRLALGQAALAGVPLPANLALAWVRLDPNFKLRAPAIRCKKEFATLFKMQYAQAFGTGMLLPKNKTKLKLVYRAASPAFLGYTGIELSFGETPDVTVLTGPVNKLRLLVDAATLELQGYSRYLGRIAGTTPSLEGLLQLPETLWPDNSRQALEGLKTRANEGDLVISFQELLTTLGAKTALTRDQVLGLARVLESINLAIEPDVLGGAGTLRPDSKVVLFSVPPGEPITRATPAYQAALLTLQLASAVATADGEFGAADLTHLRKPVESGNHLTPSHQQRLLAHLTLLATTPVSLASLKKKLDPLAASAKQAIAAFAANVAQADGKVSPAEVRMLEKVYKALGVDPKKVYSDLHAGASGTVATQAAPAKAEGFKLDTARIASLQKESEKVSALLAGIFKEEEPAMVAAAEPVAAERPDASSAVEGLLGLDEAHSSFVRMLLSRPQWSRAELLDVAGDLELMLDGALEHINEASFDRYDTALTEGDDPVEVRADVMEKLEA